MTHPPPPSARVLLTLILALALLAAIACAKMSQNSQIPRPEGPQTAQTSINSIPRINLNTASAEEFEKLPGIGEALAARIISHRERYGKFRRAEHLLMVRGMSEARFRQLRGFVFAQ